MTTFAAGDAVEIIGGPFSGFIGRCVRSGRTTGSIEVLVNIFGRETPVDLSCAQVQPTDKRPPRRTVRVDMANPEIVTIEHD